jgi:chromate reductase
MERLKLNYLGISGSLRQGSYNTAALRLAQSLASHVTGSDVTIDHFDLAEIPLYNEDVRQQGLPASVEALRDAIRAADALLIATPEYNYSVPGVLKNAIDWASRPPDQPFKDKPIAIMGASPGRTGTARAQMHLRQCFLFLDAKLLSRPEVMIAHARDKFDADGKLLHGETAKDIVGLLNALTQWTLRLRRGAAET